MTNITFIQNDGSAQTVEATAGESVMQAAVNHMIPGILADCGGGCSCATCHAYVKKGDFPAKSDIETVMLECVLEPRDNSRLTCQLIISDGMADVEIEMPESQV